MKLSKTEETRSVKVPVVAVYLDEDEARALRRFAFWRVVTGGYDPEVGALMETLSATLAGAGY